MTKILVVDDEARFRALYEKTLTNEGFDVIEASSAHETYDILHAGRHVDIVLLDIEMPRIKGTELYDVMRKLYGKVQIIVSSVYPVDEQKKMIPGAAGYYDKSEEIEVLLKLIGKAKENAE